MKIGILGSGTVGQTLGKGFASKGHDVMLGSREPEKPELQKWKSETTGHTALGTFEKAAEHGDTLVICCLGTAVPEVIRLAGAKNFEDKLLIDVTNPLDFSKGMPPSLFVGLTDSLGERIQRQLPRSRVVKCFNTVGSQTMTNPRGSQVNGMLPDMLICGNDEAAKRQVASILSEFGWGDPIDVGGIDGARWLEAFVPLWVAVASKLGNFGTAIRFLR